MRPLLIAFEDQGHWAVETEVSQVPVRHLSGKKVQRVSAD